MSGFLGFSAKFPVSKEETETRLGSPEASRPKEGGSFFFIR